jgi:putative selenium metabolism hydrolase
MKDMKEEILKKTQDYSSFTSKCLSEMVKIPSVSGEEKEVMEKVSELLDKAGIKEHWTDGLGNVIAKVGSGKKVLAIDAHIDTVDTGDVSQWDFDPFSGEIKDGYVHGRGTVDQEGGAASMITAARILQEMNYQGDWTIYFTFTIMEEDADGLCWLYLIEKENLKPDYCVITEPTNLNIYRGHRGRMEMEVYFKGLSAHASAPDRGKNTIYSASKFAVQLEELNEKLKTDELLGKGTLAPTVFQSDAPSLCAIPDKANIHIDRRLTWGETKESAVEEVSNLLGDDATVEVPLYDKPSYKGTVFKQEQYFPTWKVEEDHPLIQTGVKNFKELFEKEPVVDKWTFSTNAVAVCGRYEIPCLGFGPGNEVLAHAPNEKTPVEHLDKAAAFYAMLPYSLDNQ